MTIDQLFSQLIGEDWAEQKTLWPPDAFALCATALQRSGSYTHVVTNWPPKEFKSPEEYAKRMIKNGAAWRSSFDKSIPKPISDWWNIIRKKKSVDLYTLRDFKPKDKKLVESLILICAAADEASRGIGLYGMKISDGFEDYFSRSIFYKQGGFLETVCDKVQATNLRVLPKLHTPKAGMTIRSLSHHLALCPAGEVAPQFMLAPAPFSKRLKKIQLLLVPWPDRINDEDFCQVKGPLKNLPKEFGFFEFKPSYGRKWPATRFRKILDAAQQMAGDIDAVVFPELALQSKDLDAAYSEIKKAPNAQILIAGVHEPQQSGKLPLNAAITLIPLEKKGDIHFPIYQPKHHRWQLTSSQIEQYHISRSLMPDRLWWEASDLPARVLNFIALNSRLTISVLVCEDLARQDPISDIIRAVGPNLVISLLMDGPQLSHRWPARYATVLADDPGSSVLTLTSLGMARRSRCLGKPESQVIALWKDSVAGPYEIDLPCDAQAVVLTLAVEDFTEWTADGRRDHHGASRLLLKGLYPVRLTP